MTTEYLLTEIEQLKLERDEFKAKLHTLQVEILDMSCAKANNSGFEPSLSVYQRSIDIVIAEARKTPPQHLADIKADAVIECWESYLLSHGNAGDESYCKGFDDAMIQLENHFLQFSKRLSQ